MSTKKILPSTLILLLFKHLLLVLGLFTKVSDLWTFLPSLSGKISILFLGKRAHLDLNHVEAAFKIGISNVYEIYMLHVNMLHYIAICKFINGIVNLFAGLYLIQVRWEMRYLYHTTLK